MVGYLVKHKDNEHVPFSLHAVAVPGGLCRTVLSGNDGCRHRRLSLIM